MQNSVLDTTHVLINWQPVVGFIGIQHAALKVGAGEACVIPGRLHKRVEGIGLALAGNAVHLKLAPFRVGLERRCHTIHDHILGQQRRQSIRRDWQFTSIGEIEHGDWSSPIALPGDAPVAQTELLRDFTHALFRQCRGNAVEGSVEIEACKTRRVGERPFVCVGRRADVGGLTGVITNNAFDRQVIGLRKAVIALIMGGYCHDSTGSVVHQHVVGDPNRHWLSG